MIVEKLAGIALLTSSKTQAALALIVSGIALRKPAHPIGTTPEPVRRALEPRAERPPADVAALIARATELHAKAAAALDATTDALAELQAGLAGIAVEVRRN